LLSILRHLKRKKRRTALSHVFLKSIALLLCFLMVSEQISHAAPLLSNSTTPPTSQPALHAVLEDPSKLPIPLDHVQVQEVYRGKNNKLIIHIQDAHANLSGQRNLARMLDGLLKKYSMPLVFVEGSSVDVTLTKARESLPLKTWKRVADRFLLDGVISGEEYVNLTTQHPMKLIGVEDQALYEKNLQVYATLSRRRQELLDTLEKAQFGLEKIKSRVYPGELVQYERSKVKGRRLKEGKGLAGDYEELIRLAEASHLSLEAFPNIQRLKNLQVREREIDFELANLEQSALLEALGEKEVLKEIKNHHSILKLVKRKKITLKPYPQFLKYVQYTEEFSKIDLDQTVKELETLENKVFSARLTTRASQLTRAIDQYLTLLEKAYRLQMSSEEFQTYLANEPDFPTESWQAFLNQKLVEFGYLEDLVVLTPLLEETKKTLDQFYILVNQRDFAFLEQVESVMSQEGQQVAFLIAGGYHTQHLTQLLKKRGFSYLVLTPNISDATNQNKYEKHLLTPTQSTIRQAGAAIAAQRFNLVYPIRKWLV